MEKQQDQLEEARRGLVEASDLAHKMAEFVVGETESAKKAIFASGILYASLASMHGMTMHQAMDLLMQVYRRHEEFMKEQGNE